MEATLRRKSAAFGFAHHSAVDKNAGWLPVTVRRLLCEFAHAASRTTSVFKSKFQSLLIRRGYKRAIIAIGHKILRMIFFMLTRREHYRDSATDYEAISVQRNAPRWIKALTKFGFIRPATT